MPVAVVGASTRWRSDGHAACKEPMLSNPMPSRQHKLGVCDTKVHRLPGWHQFDVHREPTLRIRYTAVLPTPALVWTFFSVGVVSFFFLQRQAIVESRAALTVFWLKIFSTRARSVGGGSACRPCGEHLACAQTSFCPLAPLFCPHFGFCVLAQCLPRVLGSHLARFAELTVVLFCKFC